ncbi:MAG TPA: hypothetical protein VKE22_18555 [Haliangiales bacterium]|nr:hypothetical protein [Haliangiales bacterium]
MRLRVTYHRPADLVEDHDDQLAHGGLLVRVEPPVGLAPSADVEVEVAADFAPLEEGVKIRGRVLQILPGVGVAVALDPAPLADAVAEARAAAPVEGPPPTHEIAPATPRPAPQPRPSGDTAAKIQLALHGNRDDRARILRDINKMLHPYVLRNPGFGLDEALAVAKMPTASPELLRQICERKEWAQRPDIAIALVLNPKVPAPTAIRLLDYVSPQELRQLAKGTRGRPEVQQAARKKVVG